jgi:hypothetical protein
VLAATLWNWRLADHSSDWSARERGEAILAAVEPNALVLGWWETIPLVEYHQLVEGRRPDITAINRFLIPYPDMRQLIAREIWRRPIYVDSMPPDLAQIVRARPVGLLYQLCPVGQHAAGRGVVGCARR